MNTLLNQNIRPNKATLTYFIVMAIIFLISPLLGCYMLMFVAFLSNDRAYAKPLIALLTLLIFLIQMTRSYSEFEPSDWPAYKEMFELAAYIPFTQYISYTQGTEILWTITQYGGNLLTTNKFVIFSSCIVAATFCILGCAAYKFWRHTGTSVRYLIASLTLCFFFKEFLGLSNNLIRMQFAMSIMTYAIVVRYTTSKIPWLLIICASLIHTGSCMLVPLIFLTSDKKPSTKTLLYIVIAISITSFAVTRYATSLAGSSIYLLNRIGNSYTNEYEGTDVVDPSVTFIFSGFVMVCYIKAIYIDSYSADWRIRIFNMAGLFCILLLLLNVMPLVVTRLYIARYFILPLFVPYLMINERKVGTNIFLLAIIVFLMLRFTLLKSDFLDIRHNILGSDAISLILSTNDF